MKNGPEAAISRGLSYAPYADLVWCETATPDLAEARKFAEAIGGNASVGRFIPGSLTNPALRSYVEPSVLFVTDPAADQQALIEAVNSGVPVIGICDANNTLRNVDLVLPANNKGRRSLALIYWLLAREVLKLRGETDDDAWAESQDIEEWESTF